jgi:hypothetical protein
MTETPKKKLGLFSPITSREDALEITQGAAKAFYFMAALQAGVGLFTQKGLIADGVLFAILALFLHLLRSRVAAVLLFLASAAVLLSTAMNVLGGPKHGGSNVILAVIMVAGSVRAVEATFKLRSRFEDDGAARIGAAMSSHNGRVAQDVPPSMRGHAERRRIELTRGAPEYRSKGFGVQPLAREPDLAKRLRFSAAQCAFDASGLRARTTDGKQLALPWSELAEVRARVLPTERPWDAALIVDFVPAAREGEPAAPIRLLPLTGMTFRALPGTPASSRRENIRRLVLFALAQNPAATVEPESAPFVQQGTDCPRFFSMAQFSEYDARYG